MANRIVQAIYDLKDNVTAGLKRIGAAWRGAEKDADQATKNINRSNTLLSQSFEKAAHGVARFRTALTALIALVGLNKLKDALVDILTTGERFADLRKQVDTAFGGVEKGGVAFERLRVLAKDVPGGFEDVVAAAIKLREGGIDPLAGSLQALIDNNEALDGSQEKLLRTVDLLGKANLKGALGLKPLVALAQEGVPVFDLLGRALGKSKDEIREMAKEGVASRDKITLLVTELGKLRAGAAAAEMGDLEAKIRKLKDSANAFLADISNAGALEYIQQRFEALGQTIEKLAANGELQAFAQKISNGIISIAKAVEGTITFLVRYSSALVELGKAYLAIKFASFIAGMAASAKAMLEAGIAARTAAAGMGGLRGAMAAIPAQVKIAVAAVGMELAISQWTTLAERIKENNQAERDAEDQGREAAQRRAELAGKVASIVALYSDYSKVVLKSADDVRTGTQTELTEYQKKLDAARTYFAALAVVQRRANNNEGLEATKARLAEIDAQIALVAAGLKNFADAKERAFQGPDADPLKSALLGLGLSAEVAGVKITDAGAKTISFFRTVTERAQEASGQIRAAFNKAIDSAQTIGEVEAIDAAMRRAFEAGRVSAGDYAIAVGKAAEKTLEIKSAADKATGAFAGMGQGAQEQAKQTIAALEATRGALAATANDIATKIKTAFETGAPQAEINKLNAELAATEAQIKAVTGKINETKSSFEQAAVAGTEAFEQVKASAESAAEANEAVASSAEQTGTATGGILGQLVAMYQQFQAISPAAFEFFKQSYNGAVRLATSLGDVAEVIARAEKATNAAIANQLISARELADQFAQVSEKGEEAGLAFQNAFRLGEDGLRRFAEQARDGRGQLELLNQSDLDALADSAERAADKIASIKQEAQEAATELAELNRQMQDELDRRAGNEASVLEREHQDRLRRIEELARTAGEAGRAQADEARRLAERDHKEQLALLAAREKAERESAARTAAAGRDEATSAPAPRESANPGGTATRGGITINFNPTIVGSELPREVLRGWGRQLAREIEDQQGLRR